MRLVKGYVVVADVCVRGGFQEKMLFGKNTGRGEISNLFENLELNEFSAPYNTPIEVSNAITALRQRFKGFFSAAPMTLKMEIAENENEIYYSFKERFPVWPLVAIWKDNSHPSIPRWKLCGPITGKHQRLYPVPGALLADNGLTPYSGKEAYHDALYQAQELTRHGKGDSTLASFFLRKTKI